jgi:hypothetical protein
LRGLPQRVARRYIRRIKASVERQRAIDAEKRERERERKREKAANSAK